MSWSVKLIKARKSCKYHCVYSLFHSFPSSTCIKAGLCVSWVRSCVKFCLGWRTLCPSVPPAFLFLFDVGQKWIHIGTPSVGGTLVGFLCFLYVLSVNRGWLRVSETYDHPLFCLQYKHGWSASSLFQLKNSVFFLGCVRLSSPVHLLLGCFVTCVTCYSD